MELIAKISKGSKMDQVYLPKNRASFDIGEYVIIKPLEEKSSPYEKKLYFYGVEDVNPIKIEIINKIISVINKNLENYENIIITGSFLDEGFNFNDIDVIIITQEKPKKAQKSKQEQKIVNFLTNLPKRGQIKEIEKIIKEKLKIETHIIFFNKNSFSEALKIDPIWRLMLNNCISKKRLPPITIKEIKYKYLDAQLIKSKILIENFDYLTGKEKYKLIRNLMAIYLFIKNKILSENNIEKEIRKNLYMEIEDIKKNLIKEDFVKKYKNFYYQLEKEIIKNASKQEQAD
ncbi:hypothetical protein HYS72_00230 [Candidatus Pacearchaeota archaeon]|nr:hypothetical protein [Candidatus Pacearchaeota archaeon]